MTQILPWTLPVLLTEEHGRLLSLDTLLHASIGGVPLWYWANKHEEFHCHDDKTLIDIGSNRFTRLQLIKTQSKENIFFS